MIAAVPLSLGGMTVAEPISIGDAPPAVAPLAAVGKVLSALSNGALYLAGIGLVAMSIIVLWQVIVRFILNWNNSWTELTAIMIMSWFIFLGAAVGVRENYHLGFDVLLYFLPKGSKKILRTISDLVVLGFAVVLAITFGGQWGTLHHYFNELMTTQDPQTLLQQMTEAQQGRNAFLASQIKQLEGQIKDIAELRAEIESLKARQKAVE